MYTKLLNQIAQHLSVTESLQALIEDSFIPFTVAKNTIIEEEGKIPQHLYFINEGYLRSFYYDSAGDENTTYLATPENYIASFLSLSQQKIAAENIETITDCKLLKIERTDFMKIVQTENRFTQYSLGIFEKAFSKMNDRANDLATLTAEQRYSKVINDHSDLLQNVPIQYIASFLGIKPQSLSRIRKQMIK